MGKLKGFLGLAILAVAVYVGWQVLPHYIADYRFQDEMRGIARLALANPRSTEGDVHAQVMSKADELGIDLKDEQLKVQRRDSEYTVWADYEVHIDLPYYPLDLKFHPGTSNRPAAVQ